MRFEDEKVARFSQKGQSMLGNSRHTPPGIGKRRRLKTSPDHAELLLPTGDDLLELGKVPRCHHALYNQLVRLLKGQPASDCTFKE